LQYGIKVTKNNPGGAKGVGTFSAKISPKSITFSWGIVTINKSDSDVGCRGGAMVNVTS
jgi:hypothetical protein